ncbi:MAG: dihydrodipicolinate synthase family protein [Halodesulfurarchaeum sp.]
MHGIGAPLVTPFDADGAIDHEALADLTGWVLDRGLDFVVPTGSTSEAELLTIDERTAVIETVVEATAGDVPVVAGTGHPGYRATLSQTRQAATVGADAALVATPFYYDHDQETLASYYRELAEDSPIPLYLYSVPAYTHVTLEPETAADLATHENVAGMKDSSGDLEAFQRTASATADEDFDLLVGAGGVFAPALDAGATGAILAVANVVPDLASEIYELHRAGKSEQARALNRRIIRLNRAVTVEHGIPGLKAAMRLREASAGLPRRPFQPVDESVQTTLESVLEETLP